MNPQYQLTLTDDGVAALSPADSEYSVFDNRVPQLAVRVQPLGAKSWVVRGRWCGQAIRLTFGPVRGMTVEQARRETEYVLRNGVRPPTAPPPTPTFEEFVRVYDSRKLGARTASSMKNHQRQVARSLAPTFGHRPIGEIGHTEVAQWFFAYGQKAPGGANHCLNILRAIINSAIAWGVLDERHHNPTAGIRRFRRPPRGRVITSEGLGRLGLALESSRSKVPDVVDALRLLLLTGCRLGEIIGLTWDEVGDDKLILAMSKTGPKTVMIGTSAMAILRARRTRVQSKFVFPSCQDSSKPRGPIYPVWARIRRQANLDKDIRIHDLRHTFATHSVAIGESLFLTGAVLGHRRTESTARYAHVMIEQVRDAASRISETIGTWLDGADRSPSDDGGRCVEGASAIVGRQ